MAAGHQHAETVGDMHSGDGAGVTIQTLPQAKNLQVAGLREKDTYDNQALPETCEMSINSSIQSDTNLAWIELCADDGHNSRRPSEEKQPTVRDRRTAFHLLLGIPVQEINRRGVLAIGDPYDVVAVAPVDNGRP